MMDCPSDIESRGKILCYNGFGFQSPNTGVKNRFVICFCDDISQDMIEQIKKESESTSLEHNDFIGHDYLSVWWNEYDKIVPILNSMLRLGNKFRIKSILEVGFNPQKDKMFTFELMETKAIEIYTRLLQDTPNMIYSDLIFKEPLFDIWNWKTTAGKQFCKHIRTLKYLPEQSYDDPDNYFNWEIFKNCDFNTLQTMQSMHVDVNESHQNNNNNQNNDTNDTNAKDDMDEKEDKIIDDDTLEDETETVEDEDEDICMICLSNKPDTMVLPCEHCVVCKECSNKLKYTNDKNICVRCRRPITRILD